MPNPSNDLKPFQIDIPQQELDDLNRRLADARWPDELPEAGWDYGVSLDYLRDLADYWRKGYDWRKHERKLNELKQFITEIDGQTVHFAHVQSDTPNAVPLLLTHGWPSTFADYSELAGPLANPEAHGSPDAPAFHVVIPSLPGFGFSGPTKERGWDITRIAHAWTELMRRLGYERFMVHGGDTGSMVSPEIARIAPDSVIGVHLNASVSASVVDWNAENPTAGLSEEDVGRLYASAATWEERSGYATLQSTRPQTLAYALTDSPLGLLAWNLEWFVDYDPTRTEQTHIDWDAILTNITIYWLTRTSGSAARIYKEGGNAFYGGARTEHPTAIALFPGDTALRSLAEQQHNIVRWTEYERGGHFAALQAPDLLLQDIRQFTRELTYESTS